MRTSPAFGQLLSGDNSELLFSLKTVSVSDTEPLNTDRSLNTNEALWRASARD